MKALGLFGRAFGWLIALLALVVAAYFLAAWIGSSIPRNSGWTEAETGIPVMVEDNGYHTSIVMPVSASSTMTSKTSLIISGSSAEVGSSNSIILGLMQRDRAIATLCC